MKTIYFFTFIVNRSNFGSRYSTSIRKLFNDAQETLEIRDYVVAARLLFVHNMNQNLKSLKLPKKADSKIDFRKTRLIA
jgi:hypothetical protein